MEKPGNEQMWGICKRIDRIWWLLVHEVWDKGAGGLLEL